MTPTQLPSRAKPGLLHKICRLGKGKSEFAKSGLVEEIDENDRTIRATINYGIQIGFLEAIDENTVKLAPRGTGISYSEDIEDSAVVSAFREALAEFDIYRNALMKAQQDGLVTDVKGQACLTQNSLIEVISSLEGVEPADREINLLIKTASAAGLGEFVMGRRGLDTRLVLSDEFNIFVKDLLDTHTLPESGSGEDTEVKGPKESSGNDLIDALQGSGSGLKLFLEIDLQDRSDEEILELVRLARND